MQKKQTPKEKDILSLSSKELKSQIKKHSEFNILQHQIEEQNKTIKSIQQFILIILGSSVLISLVLFLHIETTQAGSPYKIPTEIIEDTNNKIITNSIITESINQNSNSNQNNTNNNTNNTDLQKTISTLSTNLFKLLFYLGTSLAVLSIVYSGFLMITSLGDASGRYKKGLNIFIYSIVGLFLMLLSRGIIEIISNIKISDKTVNPENHNLNNSQHLQNLPSGNIETEIIPQIITTLLQLISIIIIGIIIYAGIKYITEGEDVNKKEMGHLFTNAITGLFIIGTSYVLVQGILKISF